MVVNIKRKIIPSYEIFCIHKATPIKRYKLQYHRVYFANDNFRVIRLLNIHFLAKYKKKVKISQSHSPMIFLKCCFMVANSVMVPSHVFIFKIVCRIVYEVKNNIETVQMDA